MTQVQGVGGGCRDLKDQAAILTHAEQIRAAQQLTVEQAGQLVRQTRSRSKAKRTQAAPSARASTSNRTHEQGRSSSSGGNSSSSSREENDESASSGDSGWMK